MSNSRQSKTLTADRVCRVCGETKPPSAFDRARHVCHTCRGRQRHAGGDEDWIRYFELRIAEARGRTANVTITPSHLIELLVAQGGRCPLSDVVLTRRLGDNTKASLDRIQSGEGYVPGNIRIVAWAVNRMRSDMSDDELREWIFRLANKAGMGHRC